MDSNDSLTIKRHEIKEELGRGSLGIVYRAVETQAGQDVALRVLPRGLLLDPTLADYFTVLVEQVAQAQHPAIVPLIEWGNDRDQLFVAAKLMRGGTLRQRLAGQPFPLDTCVALINRIAAGLDAAHQKDVTHRNFHPANIMFDENGEPGITDFGLVAILRRGDATSTTVTIYGDTAYWSPEQALGMTLDGRSDIYSLGVILFEMLTGQLPYARQSSKVVMARNHVLELVPNILKVKPDLPPKCAEVINRAMAKKAAERAPTAGEVAALLADAACGA